MTESINKQEELTTEHELFISVSLKPHASMKTETFKGIVDDLLFENIGYMQSWGTHTKNEYIGIVDQYFNEIKRLRKALSKIVCLNISMPDEVFEIANNALEREK